MHDVPQMEAFNFARLCLQTRITSPALQFPDVIILVLTRQTRGLYVQSNLLSRLHMRVNFTRKMDWTTPSDDVDSCSRARNPLWRNNQH